jgi:glycosyltransferase involved in cell wall biosynthesis
MLHELNTRPFGARPGRWWRQHCGEIDVVHCHALHKLSAQMVARAHASGVPSLVKVATSEDVRIFAEPENWRETAHDEGLQGVRSTRWRRMMVRAWRDLRRARVFVALNDAIAADLDAQGLAYVRLPGAVDIEHFRPPDAAQRRAARAELGVPADAHCVAYVGRLVPRKQVPQLVRSVARLADSPRRSPLHLLVAGEGPERPLVERELAACGLTQCSRLTGELSDVRSVLHASDVLVNPSRREGMPGAVLEAWACGLPTLLSDVPGHRESASAGARLVALGDIDGFTAALAALVDDTEARRRAGEAARSHAVAHHALESVAERYRALYDSLRTGGSR